MRLKAVTSTTCGLKPRCTVDWPVCNDGSLYGGRKSTADGEHIGSELDDEVL